MLTELHSTPSAFAGNGLVAAEPKKWQGRLKELRKVDWRRANTKLWEGQAMIGGRVSKAHNNVILTAAVLKEVLKVPLNPEEKRIQRAREKGRD